MQISTWTELLNQNSEEDQNSAPQSSEHAESVLISNTFKWPSGSAVPSEDDHQAVISQKGANIVSLPVSDTSSTGLYTMRQDTIPQEFPIEIHAASQNSISANMIKARDQESEQVRKRKKTVGQPSSQNYSSAISTRETKRTTHWPEKSSTSVGTIPVGGIGGATTPQRDRPSLGPIKVSGLKKRRGRGTMNHDKV